MRNAIAAVFLMFTAAAYAEPMLPQYAVAQADSQNSVADGAKSYLEKQGEKMASEETPTEAPDLIDDATKVYSDWKTSGWMAGLLALVSMFMAVLKLKPINQYFQSKKIMWLKPILAGVFGAVAAGLAALIAGQGVWPALTSGVVAGLGAVGLYESAKRSKAENRES